MILTEIGDMPGNRIMCNLGVGIIHFLYQKHALLLISLFSIQILLLPRVIIMLVG